ncbi:MAG: tRNA preQ1(34) S-adenosylmethionine ribosyltransferase-isomerase QueA [Geothrix sp.]|uniref:tRNA preQ1(34) S-adenosylmethionine ribosyltransferase-isomerase QueA n=1 Tax=Geothrix sp. TaxID=1962974 RepID=UPI00180B8DD1|nr:tRNA preQ1(34) S-adenosylmethionine ribosyltransferase-isomerase QueA [Geothrix sp.]NWJ41167.1 tRNA preQ1(34) S-adenosylmethionine ribosyltransferase-isomerase QueA [Geothrix sp.]WIL20842.1 MAG: tRNA preQ1(34) S-adenosylmethionine ribosyltransferase-isomerase QueA [Geothrix sp.]
MKRSDFHFDLPQELIAQHPATERDGARLLVVDARTGIWSHRAIRDLPELLPPGSLCVPNDVRVRHARLFLRRSGGGAGEALLLRSLGQGTFEAMVKPGARLKPGASATVVDPVSDAPLARLDILDTLPEGLRAVRVHAEHDLDWDAIDRIGRLPLPPYIDHLAGGEDETRYQTVFAAREGEAVAAPTAGLHFTPELIVALAARGCGWHPVRLHVGLGTFRPMTAERLEDHAMHEERFEIPEDTAGLLEPVLKDRSRAIVCVGTTSLRTLEGAWDGHRLAREGATRLFITPGYRLRTADHLLTNFHLPESTLFVLVSALLGLEVAQAAYAEAVREGYRFFSYGDAMLILNGRR